MSERIRIRLRGTETSVWVSVADIDRGKIRLGLQDAGEFEFLREELVEEADERRKELGERL